MRAHPNWMPVSCSPQTAGSRPGPYIYSLSGGEKGAQKWGELELVCFVLFCFFSWQSSGQWTSVLTRWICWLLITKYIVKSVNYITSVVRGGTLEICQQMKIEHFGFFSKRLLQTENSRSSFSFQFVTISEIIWQEKSQVCAQKDGISTDRQPFIELSTKLSLRSSFMWKLWHRKTGPTENYIWCWS